jgi:UDP-N-acetylglucosamine 2-epimerase (non-hydrolysing)
MIDALIANLSSARASDIPQRLGINAGGFVYVTLHRPANVDGAASLASIVAELKQIASRLPVVFPMHPRTRKTCAQFGISVEGAPGLKVVEPIGYHDSLWLVEHARLVLTDSGGLQEESTYFRTPCLTLRPNTERPVTITIGSNRLTTLATISADVSNALAGEPRIGNVPPLWDGLAAARILNELVRRQ